MRATCRVHFSSDIFHSAFFLQHSQPVSLCQCDSFTPIQNNRQNYSFVYFHLYSFGWETRRQNIVHRTISIISWFLCALNFFHNLHVT
jgi:hypothetical protein